MRCLLLLLGYSKVTFGSPLRFRCNILEEEFVSFDDDVLRRARICRMMVVVSLPN